MKDALSKILDVIGKILAILLVVAFLINYINAIYDFIPVIGDKILHYVVQYGATLLVGIIAMSAGIKLHPILAIIILLLILAVVGFMFAGDIIVGYLPSATK